MPFDSLPKFLVIDDFLPATFHAELLAYALDHEQDFVPTEINREGAGIIDPSWRISGMCNAGLGPQKAVFKAAVRDRFLEFLDALGMPHFEVAKAETQLIAHGDGAFYKPHIDTRTGVDDEGEGNVRVLSLVYYFHREPKSFSGGEIALFPFVENAEPVAIEPKQNRLLAFPSFVYHEVRKISCPSQEFGDSRFAINCWLRRDRAKK